MKTARVWFVWLLAAAFLFTTAFTPRAVPLAAPAPFEKTAPAPGAVNVPTTGAVLSWTASATPGTTYAVCLTANKNNKCPGNRWVGVGSATTYNVPAGTLAASATYFWQVRATDAAGVTEADGGLYWSFRTAALPAAFAKTAPANGMEYLPASGLQLAWNASSDVTRYEYCIDTTSDNLCATGWVSTGLATSVTLNNLSYQQVYSWQVRAVNINGARMADAGVWWQFTTNITPPAAFEKTAPANTTAVPVGLSPTLTWQPSAGAVTYELCAGVNLADPCAGVWEILGDRTSYNLSGLQYNTQYYWQVRARNLGGITPAGSGLWTFITVAAPPASFLKFGPADATSGHPVDTRLEWSPSVGATGYEYCMYTDTNTCLSDPWISTGTNTSVQPVLDYGLIYHWQVRAVNGSAQPAEANDGEWWIFSTLASPLTGFQKVVPIHNAANMRLTPRLAWTDAGIVEHYEYCLVTNPTDPANPGASCTSWVNAGVNTYIDLPALANDTAYYWQVRAVNGGFTEYANTENTWWLFTTIPLAPTSQNQAFAADEDSAANGQLSAVTTGRPAIFSLYGALPAAQQFVLGANGAFTFTPVENYFGLVTFQFRVTDGINPHSTPYTATITVNEVNDAPVLASIAPEVVQTGSLVTLIASALDVDTSHGDTLSYAIKNNIPNGPTIDAATGLLSWTPTWNPTSNVYTFTILATDSHGLSDETVATITVTPHRLMLPLIRR